LEKGLFVDSVVRAIVVNLRSAGRSRTIPCVVAAGMRGESAAGHGTGPLAATTEGARSTMASAPVRMTVSVVRDAISWGELPWWNRLVIVVVRSAVSVVRITGMVMAIARTATDWQSWSWWARSRFCE
jgi:hypothetical protein